MNPPRRRWITLALSALPAYALSREVLAQQPLCSGYVLSPSGKPHLNWTVKRVDADANTDIQPVDNGTGRYQFATPAKATSYLLVFRDSGGISRHEVRRLTTSREQIVSVTIDPNATTVAAIYDRLQALEALAVFAGSAPRALSALSEDVARIPTATAQLREALLPLQQPQLREFLQTKANNLERLLAVPV